MNHQDFTEFEKLIDQRIDFCDTLLTLPEDWISGTSVAPNEEAICAAKLYLYVFKREVIDTDKINVQDIKIDVCPIPIGGVGITIHYPHPSIILYISISIYNNNKVELDLLSKGFSKQMKDTKYFIESCENVYEFVKRSHSCDDACEDFYIITSPEIDSAFRKAANRILNGN